MSRRYSWRQVVAELKAAQSTLARADVKHRDGSPWHDALTAKARLSIAEALRAVRALRAGTRAKTRRAA